MKKKPVDSRGVEVSIASSKEELAERRKVFKKIKRGTIFTYSKPLGGDKIETPLMIAYSVAKYQVCAIPLDKDTRSELILAWLGQEAWKVKSPESVHVLHFVKLDFLEIIAE